VTLNRTLAFALTLATFWTTHAHAQAPARRLELEGYGGFSLGRFTSGGELSLPAPGDPITTSNPVFPSWSVPSWLFGDGSAFLNNVMAEFG